MVIKNETKDFQKWVQDQLGVLLNTEVDEEMATYILSIENESNLIEYLNELLISSSSSQQFIKHLLPIWRLNNNNNDNKKKINNNNNKKEQVKQKKKFTPLFGIDGKEKTTPILPGRYECDCLGQKHKLINNCLKCGRIVCEQEGSGKCLFCGNLVCSKEEEEILLKNTKKSEKLHNLLLNKGKVKKNKSELNNKNNQREIRKERKNNEREEEEEEEEEEEKEEEKEEEEEEDEMLKKAIKHKNRLLDFDKNSIRRTKVIDDDCDYFESDKNKWMSKKEKENMKKKEEEMRKIRFASRLGPRKIDLDFAGREIKESQPEMTSYSKMADDEEIYNANFVANRNDNDNIINNDFNDIICPNVKFHPKYLLTTTKTDQSLKSPITTKTNLHSNQKIQDGGLQMLKDEGMALSMHQPWASLLVKGIKKHEGRTWPTNHRGVLWICSTSQKIDEDTRVEVETFYKNYYNDPSLAFPSSYPSSCILGKVILTDCLSKEDYNIQFPKGESGSDFVFICEENLELKVKLPCKGKHKIYKLDPNIHKGVKKLF